MTVTPGRGRIATLPGHKSGKPLFQSPGIDREFGAHFHRDVGDLNQSPEEPFDLLGSRSSLSDFLRRCPSLRERER